MPVSGKAAVSDPDGLLANLATLAARVFNADFGWVSVHSGNLMELVAHHNWSGPTSFAAPPTPFYIAHPAYPAPHQPQIFLCVAHPSPLPPPHEHQLTCLALLATQVALVIDTNQTCGSLHALAHEVRTPLNGILGAADLLAARLSDPYDRDLIDAIRGSASSLLETLNATLSPQRHGPTHNSSFSVRRLLEQLLRNFSPLALRNHLTLTSNFDPTIPDAIYSNPLHLNQILQNLLGNALKFTPPGGVVHLSASHAPFSIDFRVTDTGPGIPAEILPHLFRPYVAGPSAQFRNSPSSGLGLAIARDLALSLGAILTVENSPSSGVIARLHFPITAPPTIPTGLRALVVEDDATSRFILQRFLETLECSVDTACNGEDALARISAQNFDIVFMDCHMPILDGVEATRQIRKLSDVPIIAITGHAGLEDHRRLISLGASAVLVKPVDLDTLRREIATVI
jgi:two-component system, sensor histidine kinase